MSASVFSPLHAALDGTHLIEASAGTGKTWNIAALYLRLVAERKLPVEKILVVTFTKAATAELKTRLRARLDTAAAVLETADEWITEQGMDADDALAAACAEDTVFLLPLLQTALAGEDDDPQRARRHLQLRLKAAVADFDRAAVYTIHGFCQRVLQDFAFFCQVPFALALDEEGQQPDRLGDAQDFWRRQVSDNETLAPLVHREQWTPQQQLGELSPFLGRTYLDIRSVAADGDLPQLYRRLDAAWQEALPKLEMAQTTFWQIHPVLNGNIMRKDTYRRRFDTLHQLSGSLKADAQALVEALTHYPSKSQDAPYYVFSVANLTDKTKKGAKQPPTPEQLAAIDIFATVYDLAVEVAALEHNTLLKLRHDLLHYLRQAHALRKQSGPERQFDDLLLDVFNALQQHAPHAHVLAASMAALWPVALIDEFQDTDPLQYAVFRRAFAAEAGDGRALFLVGDPKQAIYNFRGADIFAYLQAAEDAGQRHSLATNRRSHSKLVNSVNALFAREQPFVLEQIAYPPVDAARADSRLQPPRAALTLRWLNEEAEENTADLERRAAAWCADEIVALLNGAAAGQQWLNHSPDRQSPLAAQDIAVLVRRHKDGEIMQRALSERGISSVLLSREPVLASDEARAVYALLQFILQPRRSAMLVFALSGSLFGRTAAQLQALNADEHEMGRWRNLAAEARESWQRFGVYAALQQFLQAEAVERQLLAQGALRPLTNLHQILELLAAENERQQQPESLTEWLGREISAAQTGSGSDNKLLRLESDEHLVKIVTMHASKGLQYPLVFCPFVWRSSDSGRQQWFVVHDGHGNGQLVHKSQLSEDDKQRIRAESLSEDLRLLYVAFTRAEEQLTLYLGSLKNQKGSNALAYLIGAEQQAKDAAAYRQAWQQFIEHSPPDTDFVLLTQPPAAATFSGTTQGRGRFQAASYPPRRFVWPDYTSFTGLLRRRPNQEADEELLPLMDAAEQLAVPSETAQQQPENPPQGITAFPQGAAAGVCLHEVMERLDFSRPLAGQHDTVAAVLEKHGFDAAEWTPIVAETAERVQHTPLAENLSFARLPTGSRSSEMGFVFHAHDFQAQDIRRFLLRQNSLSEALLQVAATLDFRRIQGFINGFIDEVAYTADGRLVLVDYKSNYLGGSQADYHQAALDAAMAEHHYYLQALIYAVAAVRYLHSRHQQPETVSIRYLFLRGLDGQGSGVWHWDIPVSELAAWL